MLVQVAAPPVLYSLVVEQGRQLVAVLVESGWYSEAGQGVQVASAVAFPAVKNSPASHVFQGVQASAPSAENSLAGHALHVVAVLPSLA